MEEANKTFRKNFFLQHPIAVYYLLTLLISWGGLILFIGPGNISSQPSKAPFLPLYFITVAGPSLAGIVLTGFYEGRKGYVNLLSRLIKWNLPAKWYVIAFLLPPLSVFLALLILTFISPVYTPGIFDTGINPVALSFGLDGSVTSTLVLYVLIIGLFNGFVEELGWTGFVTHRLNPNQSVFHGGILLGIMWGLWHLIANYLGSAEGAGDFPLSIYLAVMLFSFLPPFRLLMVWIYRHTGSLWLAILMHASLDVFWMLSMPVSITGSERVIWYSLWAVVLWALVMIMSKNYSLIKEPSISFKE